MGVRLQLHPLWIRGLFLTALAQVTWSGGKEGLIGFPGAYCNGLHSPVEKHGLPCQMTVRPQWLTEKQSAEGYEQAMFLKLCFSHVTIKDCVELFKVLRLV